jgi:ubiquinone/menaquinone biosynthesis C-methylase UbiE
VRPYDIVGLAAAVQAAHASGLLAALAAGPSSVADLAARCDLDARACARVLDVLVAFELASRDGSHYAAGQELRDMATTFSLPLAQLQSQIWQYVPDFLRSGTPLMTMDAAPREREGLYRHVVPELGKLFTAPADELARRCGLTPQSILDMGCGSGVWSLALARHVPHAHVTGLDLPAVLDQFKARAAALGLADRVATIPGDMHSVTLPEGQWDLVIIANVLRIETPDVARALVQRGVAAVRRRGTFLVVDALADDTPVARQAQAIYALHLAMRTQSGQVHSAEEIGRWMQEAGCETPTELIFEDTFMAAGPVGAVMARKI